MDIDITPAYEGGPIMNVNKANHVHVIVAKDGTNVVVFVEGQCVFRAVEVKKIEISNGLLETLATN